MKKFTLFGAALVALGGLPLSGCAVDMDPESVGTQQEELLACYTNYGMWPTKAALAVAAATELGRWNAADFKRVSAGTKYPGLSEVVELSSSAVCVKNSCKNLKGILGLQDIRPAQQNVVSQYVFNPWNFNGDLLESFRRDKDNLADIARNRPADAPPAHKLKLVGGPVSLGGGSCGPHYVFQADRPDGTPLSASEARALESALCFYGASRCGGNDFIDFQITTAGGCPSGRTCVAIDPTDGDNSTTTTTTTGSAPTYPYNRLWDPNNSKLNSACVTTTGRAGKMVSRCSSIPTTCGYLYCVAQ